MTKNSIRCPECACFDSFNEHGYCRECGEFAAAGITTEPKIVEPFHLNGKWPTNTWFQQRRKLIALKELS